MNYQTWRGLKWRWFVVLMAGLLGCSGGSINQRTRSQEQEQQDRNDQIRREAARLAERTKPEVQWTVKKLGQATARIVDYGLAGVEGVLEGWAHGGHQVVDVNSATEGELMALPGITQREARKIIQGRPYRSTGELVARGIVPNSAYVKIRDQITAK